MKKTKTNVVLFLILLLICVATLAASVSAAGTDQPTLSKDSAYSNYPYLIDSYDVNITVNENNTFHIIENIDAYFNVPKHGIFRTIPLRNKVERLDGTTSKNRIKLTEINVNEMYTTSIQSGAKVIKIGNPDTTFTGSQKYTIRYLYDLGKDTGKDYDEFYFNLIGTDWDTVIGNITFTITMPKVFDSSKVGFSLGTEGSQGNAGIDYQVEGNVIKGSYNDILYPSEALTVRLELPEGYFVNTNSNFDLYLILSFILPIIFALFSVFLWIRFGKDEKVIAPIEFYPPGEFNSAEIGFLYKGKAENEDVISLLIYLANKGYIKISEVEKDSLFKKSKPFKLTKLKNYDGTDPNERIFLDDLFRTVRKPTSVDFAKLLKSIKNYKKGQDVQDLDVGDMYEDQNEITSEDLKDSFYLTLNKITKNLNKKENRQEIFEKNSLGKNFIAGIMIAIIYLMITIRPVLEQNGSEELPFALLFPSIGFTVLFGMVFGETPIALKVFGFVWGIGFGGIPWAMMVLPALMADPMYLIAYMVGLVCVFIIVMMFKWMPKEPLMGTTCWGK